MNFERALGVAGIVLTAVAVSDRAEDLYVKVRKRYHDRSEERRAQERALLARDEAEFQRLWAEIQADLR